MSDELAYLANYVNGKFAILALLGRLPIWQHRAMEKANSIKPLRRAKGLTIEDLAERAGLSVSYLSRLENGQRRLNTDKMEAIAAALSVQPGDLLAKHDDESVLAPPQPPASAEAERIMTEVRRIQSEVKDIKAEMNTTYVPLISWVAASQFNDAATVDQIERADRIAVDGLGPGDWIALKVVGDSMNMVSPDGSIIVLNRDDQALVNKGLYVFGLDTGEATFKQFRRNPDRLSPLTTADGFVEIPAEGHMRVIGRVRKSIASF